MKEPYGPVAIDSGGSHWRGEKDGFTGIMHHLAVDSLQLCRVACSRAVT